MHINPHSFPKLNFDCITTSSSHRNITTTQPPKNHHNIHTRPTQHHHHNTTTTKPPQHHQNVVPIIITQHHIPPPLQATIKHHKSPKTITSRHKPPQVTKNHHKPPQATTSHQKPSQATKNHQKPPQATTTHHPHSIEPFLLFYQITTHFCLLLEEVPLWVVDEAYLVQEVGVAIDHLWSSGDEDEVRCSVVVVMRYGVVWW